MTITLLFKDGTVVTGHSFPEVENALRAAQPYSYASRRAFRRDMRKRAMTWTGRVIKPFAGRTSEAFLVALSQAGMFQIHVTED